MLPGMTSQELHQAQQLLASRIKALRKEAGLSQEALADLADIDRTYVSQLERCLVNPSLAVLVRVAAAVNVPVYELLGGES